MIDPGSGEVPTSMSTPRARRHNRMMVAGEATGLLRRTRSDDADCESGDGIGSGEVAGRSQGTTRSLLVDIFAGLITLTVLCHAKQHAGRPTSMRLGHGNEGFLRPGMEFLDVDGMAINAHGGGILHFNETYVSIFDYACLQALLPDTHYRKPSVLVR